jgi:quinoprotein glucose dehydrogenase
LLRSRCWHARRAPDQSQQRRALAIGLELSHGRAAAAFEATPILVANKLFLSTPYSHVLALDARTGRKLWEYDPQVDLSGNYSEVTSRGVSAWQDSAIRSGQPCLRQGDNKWANSVVALRASSGDFVWGFQVVHHDLWDYDVAAQPTLFTCKDGTPAVLINTKMGHVFVLNRLTGAPLLAVEERPVPQSDIPGEQSSPTQPFSTISLVPEQLSASDAWGVTAEDVRWCQQKISASRWQGVFTPPSTQGSIVFPGNVGGVNWGSAAYDPVRHLMVANTNRLIAWVKLIARDRFDAETHSEQDNRIYGEFAAQRGAPYGLYRTFLFSPSKLPCNAPPWGTTEAVDLYTGQRLWDVPLGTLIPGQQTGSINLGGPIIVAGGLVFTAAAMDLYLRAFDIDNGQELWRYALPAGGQATPMSYSLHGRQYLVIAAGGHGKLGTKQGDYVLAFTLPRRDDRP